MTVFGFNNPLERLLSCNFVLCQPDLLSIPTTMASRASMPNQFDTGIWQSCLKHMNSTTILNTLQLNNHTTTKNPQ